MGRKQQKLEFRAYEYVARPRRSRITDGVEESYWTVRCRRAEDRGEWSLGWFAGIRLAEQAFFRWVEDRRPKAVPRHESAPMIEVIGKYLDTVATMRKRPNTISNRQYTAGQLRKWLVARYPALRMGDFSDQKFEEYIGWLSAAEGLSPQTVLNAVVGARTFLRWAAASSYIASPPKAPKVVVPEAVRKALFVEDVDALLRATSGHLHVLIRLLWETGLRYAEAATLRLVDVDVSSGAPVVHIISRAAFVPKTEHSARGVPVTPELATMLQALASQPEERLFPCPYEREYHYWRHRLHQAQQEAGIRRFSFHELRRAVADRIRRAGIPVDVYCRFMGHAPITGLRHYSTVLDEDLRDAHEKAMKSARRRTKSAGQS